MSYLYILSISQVFWGWVDFKGKSNWTRNHGIFTGGVLRFWGWFCSDFPATSWANATSARFLRSSSPTYVTPTTYNSNNRCNISNIGNRVLYVVVGWTISMLYKVSYTPNSNLLQPHLSSNHRYLFEDHPPIIPASTQQFGKNRDLTLTGTGGCEGI